MSNQLNTNEGGHDMEATKSNPQEVDRLWSHKQHEDTVFEGRMNFFLVFESLLLACSSGLISESAIPLVFPRLVSVVGILITLIWTLVQIKHRTGLVELRNLCENAFPGYSKSRQIRDNGVPWALRTLHWSNLWVLTYVIPALVLALWILVLIVTWHVGNR